MPVKLGYEFKQAFHDGVIVEMFARIRTEFDLAALSDAA